MGVVVGEVVSFCVVVSLLDMSASLLDEVWVEVVGGSISFRVSVLMLMEDVLLAHTRGRLLLLLLFVATLSVLLEGVSEGGDVSSVSSGIG